MRNAESHSPMKSFGALYASVNLQADGYMVLARVRAWLTACFMRNSANVADLESFIGHPVRFQVETMYWQEQYDVVLFGNAGND